MLLSLSISLPFMVKSIKTFSKNLKKKKGEKSEVCFAFIVLIGELNNFIFFFTGCAPLCVHYFPHILHIYTSRSDVFLINLDENISGLSFNALFVRWNADIALSIMSFLF